MITMMIVMMIMAVNPLIQVLSFTIVLCFMGFTPVNALIKMEIRTQNGNDPDQGLTVYCLVLQDVYHLIV
ncbi:hypothetical protein SAMN05428975_4367 [Mucilaginibacter sp. OK268]|nr:hypothetical protein SAMN05428975_4367 [Mucilaginibacter sp. OK268]